jgi:hypothetical protein
VIPGAGSVRGFFGSLAGKLVVSGIVMAFSAALGWMAHGLSFLDNRAAPNAPGRSDSKECRDEVWSIDNARGPASCSRSDMASEIKDGYLVCKCKGGKR